MAGFEFRPVLDGVEFKQLYEVERDGLEEEFSNEEITYQRTRTKTRKPDGNRENRSKSGVFPIT